MIWYTIIAIIIVVLISLIFAILLNKNRLLNFCTIFAITLSSIGICIIIPFIFGRFINISQDGNKVTFGFNIIWALIITLIIYVTAILLVTVLISAFVSDTKSQEIEETFKKLFLGNKLKKLNTKIKDEKENMEKNEGEGSEYPISDPLEGDNTDRKNDNLNVDLGHIENNFEKSVDRGQIIDKMGVETIDIKADSVVEETVIPLKSNLIQEESSFDENGNYVINLDELEINGDYEFNILQQDLGYINKVENADNNIEIVSDENLTIEEYIDKAFELKEKGDNEEAILYYMYALDKGPEKALVFWIILDICVLYKGLGQSELAADILEGYISNYGEVMDESIKLEIEKNLANI